VYDTATCSGNSKGNGRHDSFANGAPPLSFSTKVFHTMWSAVVELAAALAAWWNCVWWGVAPDGVVNRNNGLLCYLQNEVSTTSSS